MPTPTTEELLHLLASVVSHADLSEFPDATMAKLQDLGVIRHDIPHTNHLAYLIPIRDDLIHPQHAPEFFAKYHRLFPLITDTAIHQTILASRVLLWRNNMLSDVSLRHAIDQYKEDIELLS
jgi:hypothetical protein